MRKSVIFLVCMVFFSSFASAALGISPAKKEYNFVSEGKIEISYDVYSDKPEREIRVFAEGDLAEYVKFDREVLIGGGGFKANVNLPKNIEIPGIHTIVIRAKEVPLEDQFLGTSISIGAIINIFVPYPGRYAETSLSLPNGNVNEEIPVETHVTNKGEETLNVNVNVDFFTHSGEQVHRMSFIPVVLEKGQDKYFRKFLNTTGYKPGNYVAKALVDYGELNVVTKDFRIGSLFVNITNFTESIEKGGIQKFNIGIESKWNNNVEDVYADVNISNDIESIVFRTPSKKLYAWGTETLEGFIDTESLEGKYKIHIVLNYDGEKSFAAGVLTVYKKSFVLILGLAVGILIVIVLIIFWIVWRRQKTRKKGKIDFHKGRKE